ncbi:heme NO-binding domain-containing protein [Haloarchaeobius sp. TZWWS8]|uniref:heme NO-binding domain-containing protein n=1 Tax=Haloarchaeobius sp. TZWWS8 TaxID=3446121 RepID=UPI003EB7462D
MHGILHRSLKGYVGEHVDETNWNAVLDAADIEPKLYLPVTRYPDEEFTAALAVVADETGHDERTVQRAVGRYLAPELLKTFKAHIKRGWETREVLLALEDITEQIRARDDESGIPTVSTDRLDPSTYVVNYRSEHRLCDLGKGIVEGIAAEFEERVTITEARCLHEGEGHCELTVEFS